jgi:hypothetical protein
MKADFSGLLRSFRVAPQLQTVGRDLFVFVCLGVELRSATVASRAAVPKKSRAGERTRDASWNDPRNPENPPDPYETLNSVAGPGGSSQLRVDWLMRLFPRSKPLVLTIGNFTSGMRSAVCKFGKQM